MVLTATSIFSRILLLLVLLPVKDCMLMLVVGEKDFKDLALHDINKLFHYRSLVTEDRQKDKETLALLRKEYELYKDQWGLNLKYSHEAGESKNYSKGLSTYYVSRRRGGEGVSQMLTIADEVG